MMAISNLIVEGVYVFIYSMLQAVYLSLSTVQLLLHPVLGQQTLHLARLLSLQPSLAIAFETFEGHAVQSQNSQVASSYLHIPNMNTPGF